jgi:hypothetical protein
MNLRTFHFVFIACSSALAFLFGVWALASAAGPARLAAASGAFLVGLALIAYEAWFLRSTRPPR